MTDDFLYGKGAEDFRQAEWLAERLKGTWRYDHTEGRWHHYDGIRWAVDKTNQIARTCAEHAAKALIGKGVPRVEGEEARKALVRLLNLSPMERALDALATFDGYGTDGSDWDQDPYLLGCSNGIVDLRYNELVPSRPEQLVTRSTGTKFAPVSGPADFTSRAPRFMEFLLQITSDYDWTEDPSVASFLLLWFGASLFGMSPEQRFLLMTGSGRNGKGALKHAILSAVGEYGCQPDANMYSRSRMGPARSSEARADLMLLKGKRIAMFSEPDKGEFNEELLKAHTGGDTITARGLYQKQPISWDPTHSITFLVNDAPAIEDIGPSMGSRVMVVDFRHRFEGENEDKSLYQALAGEKEGVLAILCWAAAAWYKSWDAGGQGITLPERVIEQSQSFIERNDPIADALREAFVVRPDVKCSGQTAYDAYASWFARSGHDGEPVSMPKFTAALEKKGFQRVRTATMRGWKGLAPLSAMAQVETDDEE